MLRQYNRLKAGRQASYDEGRFNVKATKLGALRLIAVVVILVIIFLINAEFKKINHKSFRNHYLGRTWTNEVTGR